MSQILADVCSAETSKHEYLEKSSNNTNTIVTCSCGLVGVFPYMFFKIKFQEKIYKQNLSCSIEKHQVFFPFLISLWGNIFFNIMKRWQNTVGFFWVFFNSFSWFHWLFLNSCVTFSLLYTGSMYVFLLVKSLFVVLFLDCFCFVSLCYLDFLNHFINRCFCI